VVGTLGAGSQQACRRSVRSEHAKGRERFGKVWSLGLSDGACGCPVLGLCFDFWPVAGAGRASVPASLWRRTAAKFDGLASVLIFHVFRKGGF